MSEQDLTLLEAALNVGLASLHLQVEHSQLRKKKGISKKHKGNK